MFKFKEVIEQLEAQGKEVVAITPTHVLVVWAQDNSYVSWRWYVTQGGNVATESGVYLQSTMYNMDEVLISFYERGLEHCNG